VRAGPETQAFCAQPSPGEGGDLDFKASERGRNDRGNRSPLSENVCHVDEELLREINTLVVQAGRAVFKKR
jgi:hypothetical protein